MSGILGTGQGQFQSAIQGLGKTNDLETQRQSFNKQSEQAYKQGKATTALSGAATGAMIGGEVGGPYGAVVGAVVGGIAGYLF
ncbi:MAG TPA: bacteriocin [Geobacter sp.]|nr:bacteriocin [Geobacter sp.]